VTFIIGAAKLSTRAQTSYIIDELDQRLMHDSIRLILATLAIAVVTVILDRRVKK
jgi:hypothetical protein